MHLFYPIGAYPVRRQYITYDWWALTADFGGFLGLLLGHSILSVYDLGKVGMTQIIRYVRRKLQ